MPRDDGILAEEDARGGGGCGGGQEDANGLLCSRQAKHQPGKDEHYYDTGEQSPQAASMPFGEGESRPAQRVYCASVFWMQTLDGNLVSRGLLKGGHTGNGWVGWSIRLRPGGGGGQVGARICHLGLEVVVHNRLHRNPEACP